MRSGEKVALGYDDIVAMFKQQGFTDERRWVQAIACNFQKQEAELMSEADFGTSLGDDAVLNEMKPLVLKWRALATKLGYDGPVAWRVRAGFTLKQHAPNVGPCFQGFKYLRNWDFTDEPTRDMFVFWIPRLVPDSTNEAVEGQMALLANLRRKFDLPETHLASFGSPALLAGLILAHYKTTGERVPLNCFWVRTNTCSSDGGRLFLGHFGALGLDCDRWGWGVGRRPAVGVFALGVEALGF